MDPVVFLSLSLSLSVFVRRTERNRSELILRESRAWKVVFL